MPKICIPYRPRPQFQEYHDSPKRFSISVAHRRAGKTVARINKIIRKAIECTKLNPRFGYLAPYFVQSKDIAWVYFKHYMGPIIQLGAKVNESELSITLPHNNAIIKLYGAENADRMRGLYFDGISVDEAQDIGRSVLTTVILPALADRQGWLDVSGTPKGWNNLLGELVKLAEANPDEWFIQKLRASETGLIPDEELKRQRELMPENEYMQEFEISFDAAIQGAYYAKEISKLDADGQICSVPYAPSAEVFTAWDLGYGDSTSIWWAQLVGKELRIIDYYENSGSGIDHYVKIIKDKPYNYMKDGHFLPHDAGHGSLRTGTTLQQQLRELGVAGQVLQRSDIEAGISQVRLTLPTCWFDKMKCAGGLEALRNYQSRWDEKRGVYSLRPLHNWASNGADAFRYLAQSLSLIGKRNFAKPLSPDHYARHSGVF